MRDPQGSCIEESGCLWERATLCAFNQTGARGQVQFLACMDDKEGATPLLAASQCASTVSGISDSKIKSCYNGNQGDTLLTEASKVWNKQFPQRATVPHMFVNKHDTDAEFSAMKQALCEAGSSAQICSSEKAALSKCSI